MLTSLNTAATGMVAQQYNLDVIANNLANVNTTGFKHQRAEFEDLAYQTTEVAGATNSATSTQPTSVQIGLGANFVASATGFESGPMNSTGNPYDLAINGNGFFAIKRADGTTAYTRDGSFKTDSAGNLVTNNGEQLDPPINIPTGSTEVSISSDGTISGVLPGSKDPQVIAQIQIAFIPNPGGLTRLGENLFAAGTAAGAVTLVTPGESGTGQIRSSFLEGSNVQVVDEMVRMIMAQRAYEINSKAIQTSDQMLSIINGLVR